MPDKSFKFHVFPDDRYLDLSLYQFGWQRCDALHSFGPYRRNHYLFHYIIKGKGKLIIHDKYKSSTEFEVKAGEGFFIFPNVITTYYAAQNDPWEYCWIEFDGLIAKTTLDFAGISTKSPIFKSRSPEYNAAIYSTMMEIINNPKETTLKLTSQAYLLLDLITKSSINKEKTKEHSLQEFYIKEAINFIERQFTEKITVEEIAAASGLNKNYFSKLFKNNLGQSPYQFLTNYRINKAKQFLRYSSLSIKEIAEQVGYPDQLAFSKVFKNSVGINPSQWRQKHHCNNDAENNS